MRGKGLPIADGRWPMFGWVLLVILLPGCITFPWDKKGGDAKAPAGAGAAATDLPRYREIVEKYNANTAGLEKLWSGALVAVRWEEREGKRRYEQGESSHLIYVLPDRMALAVSKAGVTVLWVGSDAQRYWLIDLSSDKKKAYVGRHEHAERNAHKLPLPVRPADLTRLLGVVAIDAAVEPWPPAVEWVEGGFLIEPPGTRTRMLIDAQTFRAKRIDIIDERGVSQVVAVLSQVEPVATEGKPPGAWPKVATRVEVTVPGRYGGMTVLLSDMVGGGEKIRAVAFDFEQLCKAMKVDEVVDLDE